MANAEVDMPPMFPEHSDKELPTDTPSAFSVPDIISKPQAKKYKALLIEELNFLEDLTENRDDIGRQLITKELNASEAAVVPLLKIFHGLSTTMKLIGNYILRSTPVISYLQKYGCSAGEFDSEPFAPIIASNLLSVGVKIALFVLPLFFINFQAMISPADYNYENCRQTVAPAGTNFSSLSTSDFDEACNINQIPLIFKTSDHAPEMEPLIYQHENCIGFASTIRNNVNSASLNVQYFVFGALLVYGAILWSREVFEKKNICMAIKMEGIYFSENGEVSCGQGISKFFRNTFMIKYTDYIDFLILAVLTITYMISLAIKQKTPDIWYFFHDSIGENAFVSCDNGGCNTDFQVRTCSAVASNIAYRVNYTNIFKGNLLVSIAEGVYFLYQIYTLATGQQACYDWIAGDEVVDSDKKTECPYYDIVTFRGKCISDEICQDWYIVNIVYPAFYKICRNENGVFDPVIDGLGAKGVRNLKNILISIHSKASQCNESLQQLANQSGDSVEKSA